MTQWKCAVFVSKLFGTNIFTFNKTLLFNAPTYTVAFTPHFQRVMDSVQTNMMHFCILLPYIRRLEGDRPNADKCVTYYLLVFIYKYFFTFKGYTLLQQKLFFCEFQRNGEIPWGMCVLYAKVCVSVKKMHVLSGAESRELADGQRQTACRFNLPASQASNFHVRTSIIQCPALSECERATVADDRKKKRTGARRPGKRRQKGVGRSVKKVRIRGIEGFRGHDICDRPTVKQNIFQKMVMNKILSHLKKR